MPQGAEKALPVVAGLGHVTDFQPIRGEDVGVLRVNRFVVLAQLLQSFDEEVLNRNRIATGGAAFGLGEVPRLRFEVDVVPAALGHLFSSASGE
jgi:hypothetical protein